MWYVGTSLVYLSIILLFQRPFLRLILLWAKWLVWGLLNRALVATWLSIVVTNCTKWAVGELGDGILRVQSLVNYHSWRIAGLIKSLIDGVSGDIRCGFNSVRHKCLSVLWAIKIWLGLIDAFLLLATYAHIFLSELLAVDYSRIILLISTLLLRATIPWIGINWYADIGILITLFIGGLTLSLEMDRNVICEICKAESTRGIRLRFIKMLLRLLLLRL